MNEFISNKTYQISNQTAIQSCPSNIALIKYWGKYEKQIPANPSISFTLNHCKTATEMQFVAGEKFEVTTFLAEREAPHFAEKIEKYYKSIEVYLPWILKGKYIIRTKNTFPHSSGIASSASGFGAIAKCLMELDAAFSSVDSTEFTLKKASFLARLGSGSACRSLYEGLVVWGETTVLKGSSDLFAKPYPATEVHPIFKDFKDWVLLIHEGEKSVSSTLGHALMNNHPYAKRRFQEAQDNFEILKQILKDGNLAEFITLVEHEALTLHALMMMSTPAFILMNPKTLEVINKIWEFRKETQLPLFFTLDAGANVHLLFPNGEKVSEIEQFVMDELLSHSQSGKIVKDEINF